jgi:hypothetical protein
MPNRKKENRHFYSINLATRNKKKGNEIFLGQRGLRQGNKIW